MVRRALKTKSAYPSSRMNRLTSHVNNGCPIESVEVFNVGELVDGEIEVLRFFKLTELEKGEGSRIVTVISSASTDDPTEERDDMINNPSVGDTKLRAYDDTNTIHSMTGETQSNSTLSSRMKSTRLTSVTEESTFDIIAALCAVHQPKYLLSDKSDWKFDDDIEYFTDDESIFTDDNGDESYHEIFKSRTWVACHLAPEASPMSNISDCKLDDDEHSFTDDEISDSRNDIDTFISERIDLDDTSCHSFEIGLKGNYSIIKSASNSEKSSVQLLEAKDFAWSIGEKAIETQLASLLPQPPIQTQQTRIEPVVVMKPSLEDNITRKVVHQKSSGSLTLDDDTYFDLEQFKHNFFGVDSPKHQSSRLKRMLGRRIVVHRKSYDSITLVDDTSFDLEQFEHDFFHMSSSKHYSSNRFERLFGRRIL